MNVDQAQWLHQFGVFVTHHAENSELSDGDGADFVAANGDAWGALTVRLLELLKGDEGNNVRTVAVGDLPLLGEEPMTMARIVRRHGRCFCFVFTSGAASPEKLFDVLLSGTLHVVPGEHGGALRAACSALDISPVFVR